MKKGVDVKTFVSLEAAGNIAAEPTSCPGLACLKKSDACDTCTLSEAFIDKLAELAKIIRIAPVFQSWHDARRDLYSSASASRGAHASIELRLAARMNIF